MKCLIEKIKIVFMVFFLLCLMQGAALADWQIYKQVSLRSQEKHVLRLDTSNGRNIRAWFILRRKNKNVFADRLPTYRVDDNCIHEIRKGKQFKGLKIRKGRWIRWAISQGERPSKDLVELMNGKELVIQYYRSDGKIMEAVFNLGGARQAVEELYLTLRH